MRNCTRTTTSVHDLIRPSHQEIYLKTKVVKKYSKPSIYPGIALDHAVRGLTNGYVCFNVSLTEGRSHKTQLFS